MATTTRPNNSRVGTTATSIRISSISWPSANFRLVTTTPSPSLDRAQTTTALITTTTNNAATSLTPAMTSKTNSHKTDSAVAIGIGVAIVVFVILGVGLGYWMYRLRRGKQRPTGHPWSAPRPPSSNNEESSSRGRDTFIEFFSEDSKRLVGPRNQNAGREREELPSPTKPTEIACVELMELEVDSKTWSHQTANVLQRVQRPSTSHSTNTTATTGNPKSPPPKLPEHAFLHPNPRSHYEKYPDDSRSTHSHMRFDPIDEDTASMYNSRELPVRKPSIKLSETNWRHQSYKASMKHSSLESNAVFLTGEGEEEAYTLFRWPELKWQSEASSFR